MTDRPNFVVFITDQHRADWLGCYGHPVVRTPHIDTIASTGTRFDNFHVASPVCMPNRASLLTGRYPSVHGLRYNGCVLPRRANTFADVLTAGGYDTVSIGKSHLQPTTDQPARHHIGQGSGPVAEAWKPDGAEYGQELRGAYGGPYPTPFATPYYGYQHVDMVTSHGDRCGGHYGEWFRAQTGAQSSALHDDSNELPHSYTCPQAFRTPVPEDLYPTSYIRDRAKAYLQDHAAKGDAPFFLFVSFPDPHHPFNPPGRYWDMYDPDQFDLPLPYAAHQNPTPPMQFLHEAWQAGHPAETPQTGFMVDDRALQEAMALTAGMISMVDDAVGSVMACLHETGLADQTIVAFTSDHGDYLGDFNMLLKGAMPFRSITRVPFIWSDPQVQAPATSQALASTIDIPATILARAGLAPFNGIQGLSLLPALTGNTPLRDQLLIEYNDNAARFGFPAPARVRTLVTDRYRLSLYLDQEWGELYDLSSDPNETHNRWDDPALAPIKAELCLALAHEMTRAMDESPASEKIA